MNIQISFTGKQHFEYTKPAVKNKSVTTPETFDSALKRYEEQKQLESMASEAKKAFDVIPTIQNASKHFQKESDHILYEAGKIQQKSEEIMSEIIDTSAYSKYLRHKKDKASYSSYDAQISLKDGKYDIKIGPHRIYATKTTNGAKDIFVFDANNRTLTSYTKNQRKMGQARVADAQYFFDGENGLSQCNINVSNHEYELVQKRFKYNTDRKENTLWSVSTMVKTALEDEFAERIFEYDANGKMVRYLRDFKEGLDCVITAQLYYEFDDENLAAFKKDIVEGEIGSSKTKLYAQYVNQDDFYVLKDYDTKDDVGYSSICFYKNGKIEGSII